MNARFLVLLSLAACSSPGSLERVASLDQADLGTDITTAGTASVSATPADMLNPQLSVVHDGIFPAQGTTSHTGEWETYTTQSKTSDWYAYSFPSAQTFGGIVFQTGAIDTFGGWYDSLSVQVQNGSTWANVSGLSFSPAYTGCGGLCSSGVAQSGASANGYKTYSITFPTTTGTAIRIVGTINNFNHYGSCGEMRVYAASGSDASVDATVDATVEAGADALEASSDATDAASTEAAVDATADAAADAPVDSGGSLGTDGGCGLSGATTGQFTLTTTVAGVPRSFVVIVPSSYTSASAVPLAFVFHGHGGSTSDSIGYGLQGAAASAGSGAIFAFPQGVDPGGGTDWDDTCSGNDVTFFDSMLSILKGFYCIDTGRVFATGFSAGADFSETLGCCRAPRLRAIAPASGSLYAAQSQCTAPAPAFRLTSGTSDPFYNQWEFVNGLGYFAGSNRCSFAASLGAGAGGSNPSPCLQFNGCSVPVVWCSYSMAHQLPSTWAADTWSFFGGF